ncbi:MAG TPA: class I SAM-dependent methyltransferase [Candidatus Binataceae bacterium]|nr:class I SAM-dependent methyltransferase [Candidatus Binataceae bacterium]
MEPSIYEFPTIFRRVHMERPGDIEDEVSFLKKVWQRHYKRPVRRVLDIACGDSPHGQILAGDKISVVGIDRSATMIAAGRARSGGVERVRFYRRPIVKFSLPEPLFDAAFFMSETFPVLHGNQDLMYHFKSVAKCLRPRGLYCIDIDRHHGVELTARRRPWRRRKVRVGGVAVEVREFYQPIVWPDTMQSIYELECTIHFPERTVVTRDVIPVRYTTPPLMELAARASGCFEMIAAYADLSFETPLTECHGRWLAVLRRSNAG